MSTISKTLSNRSTYLRHQDRARDELRDQVEEFCKRMREEHPKINCAEMHRRLKKKWPFAKMWYSDDHILTQIEDMVFDKNGLRFELQNESSAKKGFRKTFKWPSDNSWY